MRVAVGSDHRGVAVKAKLTVFLERLGHTVLDVGAHGTDAVDYPDVAEQVAHQVARGLAERGILICGTGLGMAIAANKVPGVRAAACHDDVTAEMSRRHNDLNVLCLSADLLGEAQTERLVDIWLKTDFEGGRHARRVAKIDALDNGRLQHPGQEPRPSDRDQAAAES